ncbi:ATP-dependent helicase [bacterium]
MNELLNNLNDNQQEAVLQTEGALLILAGAGSGKTRVITYRIAYLIEKGVSPFNILAVTFTNKAASEMKQRVLNIMDGRGIFISTFHSMCAQFLRNEADKIGLSKNFTICDMQDQKNLIKQCLNELKLDDKKFSPQIISSIIGRAKDNMIGAEEFGEKAYFKGDFFKETVTEIYKMYQRLLEESGNLDFGDLQFKTVEMLQNSPEILERYQERFKYIMVDEYQDTNHAQYLLIKMLCAKYKNICVVGDDDQSIYSWRGANIKNILEFEKDYKNTKIVKLERNYRSTKNILSVAGKVVKNNFGRKEKNIWTDNDQGNPVEYWQTYDEHEEADKIVREIENLAGQGYNLNDIAIFYRTNAQSRVFEEAFRKFGVPYVLVGSLKFYDRKEIKDVLAYLKVLVNPNDTINLKRIINVPTRGIGLTTLKLIEDLRDEGDSFFDILTNVSMGAYSQTVVSGRAFKNIQKFHSLLVLLIENLDKYSAKEVITLVLEESGYMQSLYEDTSVSRDSRIENVMELVSAVRDYEEMTGDVTLEGFLQHTALVTDLDSLKEDSERVTLMTLHLAKGLEFPIVFIAGMEEGLFPNSKVDYDESDLEEERRLCYVGMTRAKERLYCISARQRNKYGVTKWNLPSRFIKEAGLAGDDDTAQCKQFDPYAKVEDFFNKKKEIGDERVESYGEELSIGDKVRHQQFGIGIVQKLYGEGDRVTSIVRFQSGEMKRLLLKYANLSKI